MYKANVKINQKDYLACNLYYLRKYLGIKEIVLVALLFVSSFAVFFLTGKYLFLILSGVVVLLFLGALAFYQYTAIRGYKLEFTDRGATHWELSFDELGIVADTFERGGEEKYTHKCLYAELEKVAILKDKVYIYVGSAVCYYVTHDSLTQGNFVEFCEFLKEKIPAEKFKMRTKRKYFPYGR
ncbi:MAG TPA: hypothetical protein PKH08_06495 [Clostridia bacterium]|jgi:hypothetical protein|nr:hypothetical protein [Clostridia bacterium]HOK82093.1 hypothetical protein [Clostridia bacterium]